MSRCVSCGADNPESNRFCGGCGGRLGPTAPGRCQECGNHVGIRDKFCMFCGASLPAVGGAAPPGASVPPPSLDPEPAASPAPAAAPDSDPPRRGGEVTLQVDPPSGDVPTAAMRAPVQLKIVGGRNRDKGFITPADGGTIGRFEESDIPLEGDAYVSEEHARIYRDAEGVFVEDLDSVNGTFVKVSGKHRIKPGDEFKVGQSIFRLEK